MKDYIIWLRSGECITGTVKEDVIQDVKQKFDAKKEQIIEFDDIDGHVAVSNDEIEAVGINKHLENKAYGFKS